MMGTLRIPPFAAVYACECMAHVRSRSSKAYDAKTTDKEQPCTQMYNPIAKLHQPNEGATLMRFRSVPGTNLTSLLHEHVTSQRQQNNQYVPYMSIVTSTS